MAGRAKVYHSRTCDATDIGILEPCPYLRLVGRRSPVHARCMDGWAVCLKRHQEDGKNGMVRVLTDERPFKAALAGFAAAISYAGIMYGDMAVTGSRFDDIQLIEGAIRGRTAHPPVLGLAIHLLNGIALGEIYGLVERFLPGPAWVRGILFGELFLLTAWPATPLVDRYHPLIRQGELPTLRRRVAFLQNVGRHAAFGAALGLIYGGSGEH